MADVTIKYKGNTVAEMSSESTKTLKTSGKYCEGDILVSYIPPSTTGNADVIGTLDQSNNVLLEGNLAYGTYTFQYKKKDGTYVDIGNLVLDQYAYTNLVKPNDTNTTWSGDWVNNARMGSDGSYRSNNSSMITNTIAVDKGDVLYFQGTGFTSTGNGITSGWQMGFFKDKDATDNWYGGTPETISATHPITFTYHDDGTLNSMEFNVADVTAYVRFVLSSELDKSSVIITKNEPII